MGQTDIYGNPIINRTGSIPGAVQGLIAVRPAAGFATGDWYLATDQKMLYEWTGTAWVVVLDGSGGTAGSPTIQQVLVNGNVADGSKPLIFNNGSDVAVFTDNALAIDDASGNEANIQARSISVQDANGNTTLNGLSGTRIVQQGVANQQGRVFILIGNGVANTLMQEYSDGTGSGNVQQWVYNLGAVLANTTRYNWRDLGGNQSIAMLSDIAGLLAIGQSIGGALANAALYSDGGKLLANNTRYTFDGVTLGIPHLAGTTATPAIAAGAGAGGAGTVIAISGDDMGGLITLTAGLAPGAGAAVCRVTFGTAYGAAPKVVLLLPANAATSLLAGNNAYVDTLSITTAQFDVTAAAVALVGAVTYKWYYFVKQ